MDLVLGSLSLQYLQSNIGDDDCQNMEKLCFRAAALMYWMFVFQRFLVGDICVRLSIRQGKIFYNIINMIQCAAFTSHRISWWLWKISESHFRAFIVIRKIPHILWLYRPLHIRSTWRHAESLAPSCSIRIVTGVKVWASAPRWQVAGKRVNHVNYCKMLQFLSLSEGQITQWHNGTSRYDFNRPLVTSTINSLDAYDLLNIIFLMYIYIIYYHISVYVVMTKPEAQATALAPPAQRKTWLFFHPSYVTTSWKSRNSPCCYCVTTVTFKLYINSGDKYIYIHIYTIIYIYIYHIVFIYFSNCSMFYMYFACTTTWQHDLIFGPPCSPNHEVSSYKIEILDKAMKAYENDRKPHKSAPHLAASLEFCFPGLMECSKC